MDDPASTPDPEILGTEPNRSASVDVSPTMTAIDAPVTVRSAGETRAVPRDFDALFEQHYERLVRTLTVIAGDRETASDAVQESFVKAHLRWKRVGDLDDPAGWVRRVAINRLNDEHRRARRKRRLVSLLGRREPTATEIPEVDEFGRLLAELPHQQRTATALFYVDGLSTAEIAAALDISTGTVKSHLHDARNRLRPILEREHSA